MSARGTTRSEKIYKIKKWKIPKFLKKQQENSENPETIVQLTISKPDEPNSNNYQVPDIVEIGCKNDEDNLQSDISWSNLSKTDEKTADEQRNDIIDVKSYISQSRSDVGQFEYSPTEMTHFIRSGSYRSQNTRSPSEHLDRTGSNKSHNSRICDISPLARARSATMAARVDMDSLEIPGSAIENHMSECMSVNSRKDSGIRSNSRRSSIQQQVRIIIFFTVLSGQKIV